MNTDKTSETERLERLIIELRKELISFMGHTLLAFFVLFLMIVVVALAQM